MTAGNRFRGTVGQGGVGREQIVSAALDLLDDAGLDGLTMRVLADRMGVRAASLYWHIRDKDQLLGLLADAIVGEVAEPPAGLPWRAQLEAFATDYRRVLQAHRDAARLMLVAQPAAPRVYERLVGTLVAAGFDGEVAVEACNLLAGTYVPAAVAGEEVGGAPDAEREELGAPLGGLDHGRLELTNGVAGLTLRGDPALDELYAGRFPGKPPTVQVQDGTVRIAQRHRALQLRREHGDLALHAAIPWDVDVVGGVWKLHADLRRVRLRSLTVTGGVADMTLLLPPPEGTVPIRITGGVHKLAIHRPPVAPARVLVDSGASRLTLDTMHLGSVGGEVRWETPDFDAAADRYDVAVAGGANRMTFDTSEPPGEAEPAETSRARSSTSGWTEPLSPDEFPALAPLAGHLADPDLDARFAFGLRTLLDGLERAGPRA